MPNYIDANGIKYLWSRAKETFGETKHNTTDYWNSHKDFIPKAGELIIYEDYSSKTVDEKVIAVPNIKIGDGKAYLIDLPFISTEIPQEVIDHIVNNEIHITNDERVFWNNKVTCYINTLDDENIIFSNN